MTVAFAGGWGFTGGGHRRAGSGGRKETSIGSGQPENILSEMGGGARYPSVMAGDDHELLRQFASEGSEDGFTVAALVRIHSPEILLRNAGGLDPAELAI